MHKRASMNDMLTAALPSNRFLHNPAGDAEGEMVRNKLHRICAMADMMKDLITDEDELPPWVQDHISTAHENIDQVLSYIQPKSEKTAGPRMDAIKAFAGKLARNPVARQAAMGALGGAAVGGLTGGDLEAAIVGAALGGAGAGGSKAIKDRRMAKARSSARDAMIASNQSTRELNKQYKKDLMAQGLDVQDAIKATRAQVLAQRANDNYNPGADLARLRKQRSKDLVNIINQHKYLTPAAALAPAALAGLAMRDSEKTAGALDFLDDIVEGAILSKSRTGLETMRDPAKAANLIGLPAPSLAQKLMANRMARRLAVGAAGGAAVGGLADQDLESALAGAALGAGGMEGAYRAYYRSPVLRVLAGSKFSPTPNLTPRDF